MKTLIIGGGISGLTCGYYLHQRGLPFEIIEASSTIGGRMQTDQFEGFRLDRGFQVLLTAYEEARAILDYEKLKLKRFEPGALVRLDNKFTRFSDPWRQPLRAFSTLLSPVASLGDKLKLATYRRETTAGNDHSYATRPTQPTMQMLKEREFSERFIRQFFQPFLGGVFLDRELQTTSRMCDFVFRMFATGDAAIPADGMGAIPAQIAAQLPPDSIRLNAAVNSIEPNAVRLESGETLESRATVIATNQSVAGKLLSQPVEKQARRVVCHYFASDAPPHQDPILVLNGTQQGPINNLCVPSQLSDQLSPSGTALVSVSVVDQQAEADVETQVTQVRNQLVQWYGETASTWRYLRSYDIPEALPNQSPPALEPVESSAKVGDALFVCGDHCDTASINGAMASGRRAAEAVAASLA